jgi:hypothetical protein
MNLLYLYYQAAGKNPRYILLLELGERNGNYSGITTEAISDGDRARVIQQAPRLAGLSLERRIEWLRTHCPVAFRQGFREIKHANATVISRYPIKS